MFLYDLQLELTMFIKSAKANINIVLSLLGFMWALNVVNWIFKSKLNIFGIIPRHPFGLIGIFFSTALHGNFNHLFFNSIPFFALTTFMLTLGQATFLFATITIILLSGICVWLVGRVGVHIGASSLISGYFSYILVSAYKKPTFTSIFLALIALYYFSGIFAGLLPSEESESWEGHLSGFAAGIIALNLWSNYNVRELFYTVVF